MLMIWTYKFYAFTQDVWKMMIYIGVLNSTFVGTTYERQKILNLLSVHKQIVVLIV